MPKLTNLKAYYKNLARTFRAGTSIPAPLDNKTGRPDDLFHLVPPGTGTAFLRSAHNVYAVNMSSANTQNRMARYSDYAEMETSAEISSALDIYSHEVASKGEYGEVLRIESDDPEIKAALQKLFYDTLNIEFNLAPWVRSLCKYGDHMLLINHNPNYGIVSVHPIPINEIEREEGYDAENPFAYRYRWTTKNSKRYLEPWEVVHFRMLGNDSFLPYGMSVLESARRAWRQLMLMEDAVMVYRIVRSPERRVFYVDIGNIAPNDIPSFMEQMKNNLKRNQIVDPSSGQVDLRYNALSVEEDFFFPVRGNETGTKVDTLPGGQFTGDIDDLQYIQNKLFAALKIPKSYLGYDSDISGKSTLSQEDVRFARTIQHIQRIMLAEFEKLAMIQLYSMDYRDEDLLNFEITMANPSTINDIQRLELWRTRFEVASIATGQDGVLDRNFIYKHIFKLSDADIEGIEEGRRKDKLVQLELDSMTMPADTGAVAPMPTDAGATPGGAPPPAGGDAGAAGATPDQPPAVGEPGSATADVNAPLDANGVGEGRDPNQQRAMPNDMRGKVKRNKPFDRNYSLKASVYRMKKNGMDPRRELDLLRRQGTAPFGESDANNPDDAIFEKRLQQMRKHTEVISQLQRAQKRPKILK